MTDTSAETQARDEQRSLNKWEEVGPFRMRSVAHAGLRLTTLGGLTTLKGTGASTCHSSRPFAFPPSAERRRRQC